MSTQEMAEYLVTGDSGGVGRRLAQLQSARQAVDKMSSADKKKLVAARSVSQFVRRMTENILQILFHNLTPQTADASSRLICLITSTWKVRLS